MTVLMLMAVSVLTAPLPEKVPMIELERGVLERYVPGIPSGAQVQGLCADADFIYVSQMRQLSKFDWTGRLVKRVAAPSYTGDICIRNGKIIVAVSDRTPDVEKPDGVKGGVWECDTDLNWIRTDDACCGTQDVDSVVSGGLGCGFKTVPKALAGDRKLFMRFVEFNSRVEEQQHGEQIYARIEFFELVGDKFVDVTDRRRIVHPPASAGRGFIGAYQSGKRWDANRLMVGMSCCAPYGQKEHHIRRMKECGVDYVNGKATREALDLYLKYGIGTFLEGVYPHWWGGGAETKNGHMDEILPLSKYDDLAKGFVDHPAIWGLEIGDEPSALDFRHYGNVVQKTTPMFPNQIQYLCIYPCYALPGANGKTDAAKSQLGVPSYRAYIEEYCRQIPFDYIKTDIYPWGWSVKRSWMIENMRIVADAALASGRGWGVTMQANRFLEKGRYGVPMTANKMRFQAFNAMAFGTAHVQWGCWTKGWWTENMVNEDGSFNEPALARLKEVNGEIHCLGEEYMKFRRVSTELVAYRGTSLDDGYIRQPFVEAARSPAFQDVRTKDGSALTVGHMVARDGSGRYAMMVVAADDPDDERDSPKHALVFKVPFGRKVTAFAGTGPRKVKDLGDGSYAVGIRANEGVILVAEDPI